MHCLHDRKGRQCGDPARFDLFTCPDENVPVDQADVGHWITRTCRVHVASAVWDHRAAVIVVPRPGPLPLDTPRGGGSHRLRRTLRRRAARRAP